MVDYATWSAHLGIDEVRSLFTRHGCDRVIIKELAARQDNDKNQIYVGTDMSSVSMIPTGEVEVSTTASVKPGARGKAKLQAPVRFQWLTEAGATRAPDAKFIYYPQYPEVRFSGFLRGTRGGPNDLLSRTRRGQEADRLLLLGISEDGSVWGLVLSREAAARSSILAISSSAGATVGRPSSALRVWELRQRSAEDSRALLLDEMARISALGWIPGAKLSHGELVPYKARNGGGYTLEAMLGISPNGYAEPDFLGWEIKQHGVKSLENPGNSTITLFTPEPTAGVYVSPGFQDFMTAYGYPDKTVEGRINFGGIYRAHIPAHAKTKLRLIVSGFHSDRSFDLGGSIALVDEQGQVAAEWSFAKLMDHWKRKHAAACYVPSLSREVNKHTEYRFGQGLLLAGGATSGRLLAAIDGGRVYLDPAMKLIVRPNHKPEIKRRSQFRSNFGDLEALYSWADYYGGHPSEHRS